MKLLHAGCGRAKLPEWFTGQVEETRLDIDPNLCPDIVASITDMGEIGQFDMVYSSHCIEHLYPQDVVKALAEFHRVTTGGVVVIVPDLEDVKATEDMIYESPGGPLCGLDLIYGCRTDIEQTPYMAHHSGFVSETLELAMKNAGFQSVTMKRLPGYNLMAIGVK